MLYGHGDDAYLYKQAIVADFSTNVWYGGEPGGLKQHLFDRWNAITRYPPVLAESLSETISSHHQLHAANILVTNGTTESIYLIAHAFRARTSAIAVPAFAEYEDACRMHDHRLEFLNWHELNTCTRLHTDLFFICNPNNPTGMALEDLIEMARGNPDTVFVIDEAFIEFTLSVTSMIGFINDHNNIIILRSLTKAFTIPGLRLGYIAAAAHLIEQIRSRKAPWSVNALAIEAGHFIFDHHASIQLPLQQLLLDKEAFIRMLQDTPIHTHPSHTHYFLAETACATAKELKQYLAHHHGILIRDASNFRALGERHIRLATLSPVKNQLLTDALKEWKQHCS